MHDEFWEYLEILRELFGSATLSILMLKAVAVLYPALSFEGIGLGAPLLVIVQNESQLRSLLGAMQGYGWPVLKSLAAPPKEICKTLTDATYNLVLFRYSPGRYLLENLEQLKKRASEIDLSTPSNSLLIIIVAVGGIPVRYFDNIAGTIYIQNEGPMEASIETLPEIERPLILRWLKNGGKHLFRQNGESFDVFRTASAFLVDTLWDSGYGKEELKGYEGAFAEGLEELEAAWDMPRNLDDYMEAFRTALFEAVDWLPRPIFDRKKVEGLAIEDLKLHIFWDCNYYYLPPAIFEALCKPLAENGGMAQIKIMLTEAGLLIPEKGSNGRNYFTPKVELITAMGYRERVRMIRLSRDKVDLPGDLSFKEIMETRGGGFDDQNR